MITAEPSGCWWRYADIDSGAGAAVEADPAAERARFLCFSGATIDADFRDQAEVPLTWISEVEHVICGLEIPYLPEPYSADLTRVSRTDASTIHQRRLAMQFSRIVHALYIPALHRGYSEDGNNGHCTFDLRLLNSAVGEAGPAVGAVREGSIAPTQARLLILVRVAVVRSMVGSANHATLTAQARAIQIGRNACRQIRALAPREVTFRDICWLPEVNDAADAPRPSPRGRDASRQCWLRTEQALLGKIAPESLELVDVRRAYWLDIVGYPKNLDDYVRRLASGADQAASAAGDALLPLHYPWPAAECSLMPTLAAITASDRPAGLTVRLRPTAKTPIEINALIRRLGPDRPEFQQTLEESAVRHLLVTLYQEELFQSVVQIAAEDEDALQEIVAAYAGEHQLEGVRPTESQRRFACVRALDSERDIAAYNLGFMETMHWGSIRNEGHKALAVPGNRPLDAPMTAFVSQEMELRKPEVFLSRDAEFDSAMMRLRSLVTVEEAMSMWRLPVPEPGGQAGVVSRLPNPFEQLPEESPDDGDAISMGVVQHRGRATGLHFRLPLIRPVAPTVNVAGVGDRVLVVAGSPGSGKTNFCLSFLGQLWDNREVPGRTPRARYPYLVIDPTRGNEFRQLSHYADPDLLIFTVGDGRCSPLRFNPFIVPKDVSVQTHISRLMSCFKAAYHMWDPLPAIFEMAIKRAYQGRRARIWATRNPGRSWLAAEDFPQGVDEPFPNLDDVIAAMGRGQNAEDPEQPELWPVDGKPTVMFEQREMWGGQTENAATIVASTFLRLHNLRDSFGHILGAGRSDEPLIDFARLLERPVVLEMGMVGDSQALSLIMAFLLICLRGTIETTGPELRKRAGESGGAWMNMLVIEEAHLLLSAENSGGGSEAGNSKAQAAEDINNMLAEVRKYGQGVMLLDQRPGSLVGGAIDNAYAICMHRLNEEKSFRQFSQLLNLTTDQQRFARTELRPGEMITLDRRSGLPVLVRPPNERTDRRDLSDDKMRTDMAPRRAAVCLAPCTAEPAEQAPAPASPPSCVEDAIGRHSALSEPWQSLIAQLSRAAPDSADDAWSVFNSANGLVRQLARRDFKTSVLDLLVTAAEPAGVSPEQAREIPNLARRSK
jgi:hypothetical protein